MSREAEDQRLPPKAAPISLTAFTKTQAISRNKGQKAWKPLNLDEIAESSDDASNDQFSGRGTPILTPVPNALDRSSSYSQRRVTSYAGFSPSPVPIPVAPRAMVRSNSPNTILANPTPQRQVSYPIVNLPTVQERQGFQDSPSPADHGGLPNRVANTCYYLRQTTSLVSPATGDTLSLPKYGNMMTPDDLSPAKQEEKFARLSSTQDPAPHLISNETFDNMFSHQASSSNLPYQHRQNDHYYLPGHVNGTYSYDVLNNGNSYSTPDFPNHHTQKQARNLYEMNDQDKDEGYGRGTQMQTNPMNPVYYDGIGDFDRSSYLSNRAHQLAERNRIIQAAFQKKLPIARTPLEIKRPNQSDHPSQPVPSIVKTEDEPYDRNSKMQTFVAEATQEALSRKGKTVLHNPELNKQQDQHRIRGSYQSPEQVSQQCKVLSEAHQVQQALRPVPWPLASCEIKVATQATPPSTSKEDTLRSTNSTADESNAAIKPPPGLEHLQNLRLNVEEEPIDTTTILADGVGSFAWCQLRPFNEADRTRTRACMAKAAATLTVKIPQPPIFGNSNGQSVNETNLSHSTDWFNSDERGEQHLSHFQPLQKLRAQLPEIAEKHAISRRNIAATANGGDLPEDFRVGIDDGYTTTVVLGEIAANLLSYSCGDHKSEEQRRNFHKVKSVPEFAIERGGVLGAVPGASETIFDDHEGGFQGAPVRIARDPRFRPQGKEGLKLKPEEEWRDRHEMYGRRMM